MTFSTHETAWLCVGFVGQGIFTARFVVQWVASEKCRNSVVPIAFWWISLVGGLTLLIYAIERRDPVIITGQAMGLLVYVRNLMLLRKACRKTQRRRGASPAHSQAIPRPHLFDPPSNAAPHLNSLEQLDAA